MGEVNIMKTDKSASFIRGFVLELVIYSMVIIAYFFLVLRYLKDWLGQLYDSNLMFYAFVSLGLIVVQVAFLEVISSFLLNYISSKSVKE